jgi:Cu/Ag efflux protein CusF
MQRLFASLVAVALLTGLAAAPVHAQQATSAPQTLATGSGKVNAINAKTSTINITHGPIEALKWPAMTMDFLVLPGTDVSGIKVGDTVTFTLGRAPDGMYAINGIKAAK